MSAQIKDNHDINIITPCNTNDQTNNHIPLKSKLERRRRIEDINEERRLHKELYEF